ncbi:MAG TPA: pilus assembly protein [Hyphomicrobiaceae bacterium]|nr:pilus assembly protein [Hyphomicrobiaceae bacterium]
MSILTLVMRDAHARSMKVISRWQRDASGVTAIEFAMVAMPFLMLLFGIIGIGLYYFTTFSMENAVEQAARLIRTGQAQQTGMNAAQFKAEICSRAPGFIDCTNKLRVSVKTYNEWTAITPATQPKCLDEGNLITATEYSPGGSGEIVLVWVCLEWDFAAKIPFLNLADMSNGSRLIQVATTFRTEPYQN